MASIGFRGNKPYTYLSQPQVVPRTDGFLQNLDKRLYREYHNIMYDYRVLRGNTYSKYFLPERVRRSKEIRNLQTTINKNKQVGISSIMQPVCNRQNVDVQTVPYLEELSGMIEQDDMYCQTAPFLDRPPTPLFIPSKAGVDKATEILPNDLFIFNVEVKPILEVLVGRTMEQALLEVSEEEELENIRQQQIKYEEIRQADLAEMQRLKERQRRISEEKERRKKQHLEAMLMRKEVQEKLSAYTFTRMYLQPLVPVVFDLLYENGYFYDVVEQDVETNFLPWLMDSVNDELEHECKTRALLDQMIREVVFERNQAYQKLDETTLDELRMKETAQFMANFANIEEVSKVADGRATTEDHNSNRKQPLSQPENKTPVSLGSPLIQIDEMEELMEEADRDDNDEVEQNDIV